MVEFFHLTRQSPQRFFQVTNTLVERRNAGALCLFSLFGCEPRSFLLVALAEDLRDAGLATLARKPFDVLRQVLCLCFVRTEARGEIRILRFVRGGGAKKENAGDCSRENGGAPPGR